MADPRVAALPPFCNDEPLMNRLLALFAVLALGGCASATPTVLKNGKQGLSIDCSGAAASWDACYQKAAQACDGGRYDIVGTAGTAPKDSDKTLGADIGNYTSRTVTVVCK